MRFKNFPVFISETGIEDEHRPEWFSYVGEEVRKAVMFGVPVKGVCLYPIVNHPVGMMTGIVTTVCGVIRMIKAGGIFTNRWRKKSNAKRRLSMQ
jgi:hypothetical protein